MPENKAYYAVIPAGVRYDKDLCANAKLLYGEITALANEKGYCWASNNYFAELYGVETRSISNWVKQLYEKGYIAMTVIYKQGSKEIAERRIYITPPMENIFHTPTKKNSEIIIHLIIHLIVLNLRNF